MPKSIETALRDALAASGIPLLTVQRETGVHRTALYKFLAGTATLRMPSAAAVAAYLNLELTPAAAPAAKPTKGRRP